MDNKLSQVSLKDSRVTELGKLHQLFLTRLLELTDSSGLHFTSSFSRLSYLISTKLWNKKNSYLLHSFRKAPRLTEHNIAQLIELGNWAVAFINEKRPSHTMTNRLYDSFKKVKSEELRFEGFVSAELTEILTEDKKLFAQRIEEPFDKILINYGDAERNEDFTVIIESLRQLDVLPINILLHEVEIDENGLHSPNKIIFDPDYLHIVTSISECFTPFGTNEIGYLLRKISPHKSSSPLILGNIANYFLDRLIYDPELNYEQLQSEVFSLDLIGLSLLNNTETRSLLEQCRLHFEHLKKVVNIDLSAQGISAESTYVEPTFYSVRYGIQGRLDLFYKSEDQASIVELKSGSPFKVNTYGLNSNHYHQLLLYDMLIKSVYGYRTNRKNFILYSKESNQALRYAPTLKVQQRETILQRNRLYLLDRYLERNGDIKKVIKQLYKENIKSIKGYTLTEVKKVIKELDKLDDIEYAYIKELFKHLSREQYISKIGDSHAQRSRGLSSLWKDTVPEKVDQFNIINHLTIEENYCSEPDPLIYLAYSVESVDLHNFRVGDLCILYADQKGQMDILSEQVFKSTIVELTQQQIVVRLRSRQKNLKIFNSYQYWHVEHDRLDNSFSSMSRSVYEFITHPKVFRDIILQRNAPSQGGGEYLDIESVAQMTDEQNTIYREIIRAKGYYLLWGPPGTGKTSVMLKHLTDYYVNRTEQRILLLAYTNRAVDEICASVESISSDIDFIRIGSRYSTHDDYRSNLLNRRLSACQKRSEVRYMLESQSLYIGTIASVLGKTDLFSLVTFDLVIIDEASQVLDSQLIGLLGRFKKFVLVGDHKQLPAVTHQSIEQSKIDKSELQALGINSLANSLFERMYTHAVQKNWNQVYGQLSNQGRMHQELMAYANDMFYENSLNVLTLEEHLTSELSISNHPMLSHRLLFIDTQVDEDGSTMKINQNEAVVCYRLLKAMLLEGGLQYENLTIGIITPYRAQIACIQQLINNIDHPAVSGISIDTVERYQGSARDIIILSTCMNYRFQLNSLQSLSQEGIDRKLNVAFTRAREQFILVGNQTLLEHSQSYAELIARSHKLEADLIDS